MRTTDMVARPKEWVETPGRPLTPDYEHISETDSQPESFLEPTIENKRLREVARYYCAVPDAEEVEGASISPQPNELSCDNTVPRPKLDPIRPPELSVDPALTAFAQLGALKLDCDRSFISIIDHDRQYILAEATRTISLEEKDNHDDGDAIYLGRQALPIYWGVCPGTIQTFTDRDGRYALDTRNISADKTRYIIRNFMDDLAYRDRPYVAGWPFMRFYAEVPVKSPNGMVIGSYCVVDNKPRAQFGDSSVKVLEEVARSVSHYLELTRMKLDYDRAVKLITGLSSFVDNQRSDDTGRRKFGEREKKKQSRVEDVTHVLDSVNGRVPSNTAESVIQAVPAHQLESSKLSSTGSIGSEDSVAAKAKQTFQRASNLICESMDLDGCTFIDAYALGTSNRSSLNHQLHLHTPSGSKISASSLEEEEYPVHTNGYMADKTPGVASSRASSDTSSSLRPEHICEVLAFTEKAHDPILVPKPALPIDLLHQLLRRYPTGHIFNHDSAELESTTKIAESTHKQQYSSLHQKQGLWKERSKVIKESALLFSLFPQACSIIFFPLFDSFKNQWCAACIGWTANRRRGLQNGELTYLAAFSNSIIAELGRLEAVAIGQAKTTFISNISHELRSPLHGILASAELLQESSSGANQTELISMVDSCGRTLLETMNHLLDHAKINNFAKQKSDGTSLITGSNGHESIGLVTEVDLQALVEEVVEAMFTGYAYQKRMAPEALTYNEIKKTRSDDKETQAVVVFLDIGSSKSWIYATEAGAWRRLIMNVFGNSLKYTTSGSIEVSMHAENVKATSGTAVVHLRVSDTGKGISKDYLKHKLYSPFSQEDSLAVGAGLGLSIVRQIVDALSGTVEVESEVSVGTTVMISIPLKSISPSQAQIQAPNQQPQSLQHFDGTIVCLLDLGPGSGHADMKNKPSIYDASQKSMLTHSLKEYLQGIRGLTVRSTNYESIVPADVYIVEEQELMRLIQTESRLQQVQRAFKDARLILLRTDTSQTLPAEDSVVHLSQPFSATKLRKALLVCLERGKAKMPLDLRGIFRSDAASQDSSSAVKLAGDLPKTPPVSDDELPQRNRRPSTDSHPHVLIVDDNVINRKIMCTFMQKLKCTYATAADGLQAVEAYKKESGNADRTGKRAFDWILMDITMPVMDGLTATRAIRAFEKHNRLPSTQVVALTGLANTKTRDEATASGVNLYLTKPVQLKVLKNILGLE